jgi:hypothetical protein
LFLVAVVFRFRPPAGMIVRFYGKVDTESEIRMYLLK